MSLVVAASRVLYPYDLGGYEACVWTPARLIASGVNPYNFATEAPFIMAPYGPLYYFLVGIGLRLFGDQFWFGRTLSLAATLVCIFCVFRISSVVTSDRRASFLTLITALSLFPLQNWLTFQRPDLPALALASVGLMLVFTSTDERDTITTRSFVIVLLFVAAFFCKHTMFLFVGVAAVRSAQAGAKRNALFIVTATSVLCLVIMVALNSSSNAGHFWQHWVLGRSVPRSSARAFGVLSAVLKEPTTWVVAAVIIAGIVKYLGELNKAREDVIGNRTRPSRFHRTDILRSPAVLIWTYLIVASCLAFTTSSFAGSNVNYWLEAMLVASVAIAVSWHQMNFRRVSDRRYLIVVLLLTSASTFTLARMLRGEYFRWSGLAYHREIVAAIGNVTPPHSTSISMFPELVAYAERDYHFGDWIQYYDGRSPLLQNIFREAIASGRYAAIVWSTPDPLPGYHLRHLRTPPDRVQPLYLFVRANSFDGATNTTVSGAGESR